MTKANFLNGISFELPDRHGWDERFVYDAATNSLLRYTPVPNNPNFVKSEDWHNVGFINEEGFSLQFRPYRHYAWMDYNDGRPPDVFYPWSTLKVFEPFFYPPHPAI